MCEHKANVIVVNLLTVVRPISCEAERAPGSPTPEILRNKCDLYLNNLKKNYRRFILTVLKT